MYKQLNVKITNEQMDMLEELCILTSMNKTVFIQNIITAEYDRIKGNPKLKEILQQMKILQEQIEGIVPKPSHSLT